VCVYVCVTTTRPFPERKSELSSSLLKLRAGHCLPSVVTTVRSEDPLHSICNAFRISTVVAAVATHTQTSTPEEEARRFGGLEEVENDKEIEEEESVKKTDCGSEVEIRRHVQRQKGGGLRRRGALERGGRFSAGTAEGRESAWYVSLSCEEAHTHTHTHTQQPSPAQLEIMHLRREQEEIDEVREKEQHVMLAHKGYSGFSVTIFAKECNLRGGAPEQSDMQRNTTDLVEGEVGEEMSNEEAKQVEMHEYACDQPCDGASSLPLSPSCPLSLTLVSVSVSVCMSVRVLRVGSLCIELFCVGS
jgi:hypothetical protein